MCKVVLKSLTTPTQPSNAGNYRAARGGGAARARCSTPSYPAPTFTLWTSIVALELITRRSPRACPIGCRLFGRRRARFHDGRHPSRHRRLFAVSNNDAVGWGATRTHDGDQRHQSPRREHRAQHADRGARDQDRHALRAARDPHRLRRRRPVSRRLRTAARHPLRLRRRVPLGHQEDQGTRRGRSWAATSPSQPGCSSPGHRPATADQHVSHRGSRPATASWNLTAGGGGYATPPTSETQRCVLEDVLEATSRPRPPATSTRSSLSGDGRRRGGHAASSRARAGAGRHQSAVMSQLDGATVEVIRSYLVAAAEEMRRTLIRTAFNPVIYEVLDFGISIYDRELRLIAEAPGLTFFLGANDYSIRKGVEYVGDGEPRSWRHRAAELPVLERRPRDGRHAVRAGLRAGDDTRRSAYTCIRAHWMDLGAKDSGLRARLDRHAPGGAHLPRHEGLQARAGPTGRSSR